MPSTDAREKPAWLDELRCASSLEKTFLYEEVFGGSYFDEGVSLPGPPVSVSSKTTRKRSDAKHVERPPPLNIIDVGGNIGLFALYCLEYSQGHVGRLITLEPVQETYDLLLHNLDVFYDYNDTYLDVIPLRLGLTEKRNQTSDEFYVFPRALGWSGRSDGVDPEAIRRDLRTFVDNSLEDPSSNGLALPQWVRSMAVFLKHYLPFVYAFLVVMATKMLMLGAKRVQCPTSTLSKVIDEYIEEEETVSLLKIDVEGGELNVLRGLAARHWGIVEQMVIECTIENLGEVLKLIDARGKFESVVAKQTDDLQGTSLWMIYCSG